MIRSLQVRVPLLAVGAVALSLTVAVIVVFQVLRVGGERELDSALDVEANRIRAHLGVELPGALSDQSAAPTADELAAAFESLLADEGRISDSMTVARINERILTTAHAANSLELLRDQGQLPQLGQIPENEVVTLETSEGDVHLLGFALRVSDGGNGSVVVLGSIEEARRGAATALGRITAASVMGLAIAGLLLFVTMRRALRPLGTLARAASMAELEDLGERVDLGDREDEVGELAREFNRMLDRLQDSVADHRRFMAAVSHELRTPVTIARGHLELLTREAQAGSAAGTIETVRLVEDELQHMQRLIADLMALGRSADDDFVLAEPVSLRDFLDELQLRVVGLGTRDVLFEPVDDDMILADRDRLAQAMLNVIVNAELHASGHTRIVVGQAAAPPSFIGLCVRDDGGGVDVAVRDSLFQPFVTSGGSDTSTGLGLAVVEAVATAHGGSVDLVTSTDGTTVTILIPRSPSRS